MKKSRSIANATCLFCETFSQKVRRSHKLRTGRDALVYLKQFRDIKQEYFVVLSLDSANHLIRRRIVTVGLLNTTLVHPREVFIGAVYDRAASVILAHNHPSGEASPSREDIEITQQLIAAGILLGIKVRDHVIVTKRGYFSFSNHHLIS